MAALTKEYPDNLEPIQHLLQGVHRHICCTISIQCNVEEEMSNFFSNRTSVISPPF